MRKLPLAAAVLAALALVPAAGAWTKLTGDTLQNIVDPTVAVLPNGTELIGYREPTAGNYKILRGGSAATIVSGRPLVGDGVIVRQAGGALVLYLSDDQGVVSSSSTDGGATWSAPAVTGSHDVGDVQSAAVRPDGTTLYSQDGTGFVNVFTGPAGGPTNVFPSCCGYAETLAVDTGGLTQIAFWSNATGQSGYLYGPVGGPYRDLSAGKESLSNDARVPLVADTAGAQGRARLAGVKPHTALTVTAAGYAPAGFRVP